MYPRPALEERCSPAPARVCYCFCCCFCCFVPAVGGGDGGSDSNGGDGRDGGDGGDCDGGGGGGSGGGDGVAIGFIAFLLLQVFGTFKLHTGVFFFRKKSIRPTPPYKDELRRGQYLEKSYLSPSMLHEPRYHHWCAA